jgi:hypothetical protein
MTAAMTARTTRLILLCLLLLPVFRISAQAQAKTAAYNAAVDRINCETIRFIHREAGRVEVANNLDCTSFEAILKSIPEDEAATTQKLCKDIEAFKSKFKEDKPMDKQLDAVIDYAYKRINAKKRKGNVANYKEQLEGFKTTALADAGNGDGTAAASAQAGDSGGAAIDTSAASADEAGLPSKPAKKRDWLGIISLVLALGSLGFCIYLYGQVRKRNNDAPSTGGNGGNRQKDTNDIQRLENRLNDELRRMNSRIEEKLGAITASTGYTQPERETERETAIETEKEPEAEKYEAPKNEPYSSPAAETAPAPEPLIYKKLELDDVEEETTEEPEAEEPEDEEILPPVQEYRNTFRSPEPPELETPEPSRVEEADKEPSFSAASMRPLAGHGQDASSATNEETEEEGESMPAYRYAGLPKDGYFMESAITDNPAADSIFEIELYEDVPNKAFFSLLPYPEVIRKALADPDIYLAGSCIYSDDPAGKKTIVLIEEGMLRKQDDRWFIYEPARIRFE